MFWRASQYSPRSDASATVMLFVVETWMFRIAEVGRIQ